MEVVACEIKHKVPPVLAAVHLLMLKLKSQHLYLHLTVRHTLVITTNQQTLMYHTRLGPLQKISRTLLPRYF